ncbi:hypothetical protein NDU88_001825 [Pleurodeles waltl]|uniref:Uncharacterized protein n=1 Tax=Pleurodeles waltl TaxID=8319 RepID=A0AAV7WM24_PLEWA|nr:hypothetical protein NDU88_001825 [Pleurodeles waltl]
MIYRCAVDVTCSMKSPHLCSRVADVFLLHPSLCCVLPQAARESRPHSRVVSGAHGTSSPGGSEVTGGGREPRPHREASRDSSGQPTANVPPLRPCLPSCGRTTAQISCVISGLLPPCSMRTHRGHLKGAKSHITATHRS